MRNMATMSRWLRPLFSTPPHELGKLQPAARFGQRRDIGKADFELCDFGHIRDPVGDHRIALVTNNVRHPFIKVEAGQASAERDSEHFVFK